MAPIKSIPRWQRLTGYGMFFSTFFSLGLYLSFPYEALKARIVAEAEAAGFRLSMERVGPGIFGVTAHNVRLTSSEGPEDRTPLKIDSLAVRPSLLPLGVAFRASLLEGVVAGNVGGIGDVNLSVEASSLKLDKGNLKEFSGMDLAGELNGELSLDIPTTIQPGNRNKTPDLGQANGTLSLDGSGLLVKGGNVTIPMGGTPVEQGLPRIPVGDLKSQIKFVKGLGTVESFFTKSPSMETRAAGTVQLNRMLGFSEANLEMKVKTDPEFVKGLGPLGMALSFLGPDKQDPSFRGGKLTGRLARPTFLPLR